jgi:hypothetical protein
MSICVLQLFFARTGQAVQPAAKLRATATTTTSSSQMKPSSGDAQPAAELSSAATKILEAAQALGLRPKRFKKPSNDFENKMNNLYNRACKLPAEQRKLLTEKYDEYQVPQEPAASSSGAAKPDAKLTAAAMKILEAALALGLRPKRFSKPSNAVERERNRLYNAAFKLSTEERN